MSDRLFDMDEFPEVPLLRAPRRRAQAARGVALDSRFQNEYPPEWTLCTTCRGIKPHAFVKQPGTGMNFCGVKGCSKTIAAHDGWELEEPCPDCLGMGSLKALVRLQAGHRCVRCQHPYMPKGDARMLGVEPSGLHECPDCEGWGRITDEEAPSSRCRCGGTGVVWTGWSRCDDRCTHAGPWRFTGDTGAKFTISDAYVRSQMDALTEVRMLGADLSSWDEALRFGVEAEWRILTVHHLDGDKANCRWWNLAALCQRCHLEIQAKVVMERVYPHEHSEWFRPFVAGYYAFVYLCKTCGSRIDQENPSPLVERHPPWHPDRIPLARTRGFDEYPHRCEAGLELTRGEVEENMDFLLALELA